MKTNRIGLLIGELLAGVAWMGIVLLLTLELMGGGCYWAGFVCALVSILIVAAVIWLHPVLEDRSGTESMGAAVWFSALYLLISLIRNTVAMFCPGRGSVAFLVIFNLLALGVYAGLMALSAQSVQRLTFQLEKEQSAKVLTGEISARLGEVLSRCTKTQRSVVHPLKEMVDYSNNLSQSFTRQREEEFLALISELGELVDAGEEGEALEAKAEQLRRTWGTRNAADAAKR